MKMPKDIHNKEYKMYYNCFIPHESTDNETEVLKKRSNTLQMGQSF